MDFSLGEDRQMLVDTLGRFLAGNFDWKTRETVIETAEGWSRPVWAQLAELGVIGALFDEASGGFGGSAFDIGVVFAEVGKVLAVGPFLGTLLAGRALVAAGETALLEQAIAGEVILSAALDSDAAQGVADGEGWALTGTQPVVPFAASADRIVALKEGRTVFDGAPDALTPQVLTDIYGEEDWSTTIRRGEDENEGDGKKKKSVKEKGFLREASAG